MKQQINLYQERFRGKGERLSLRTMTLSLLGIAAGLALLVAADAWRLNALSEARMQAQTQLQRVTAERDELRARLASRSPDPVLAARVRELETVLAHQDRLGRILRDGTFRTGRGYSDFFVAFARQHVEGMWLTGIRIAGAGRILTLRGRTTKPELVPRYIQRLKNEDILAGTEFREFRMRLPKEGEEEKSHAGSSVVFELTTAREGASL